MQDYPALTSLDLTDYASSLRGISFFPSLRCLTLRFALPCNEFRAYRIDNHHHKDSTPRLVGEASELLAGRFSLLKECTLRFHTSGVNGKSLCPLGTIPGLRLRLELTAGALARNQRERPEPAILRAAAPVLVSLRLENVARVCSVQEAGAISVALGECKQLTHVDLTDISDLCDRVTVRRRRHRDPAVSVKCLLGALESCPRAEVKARWPRSHCEAEVLPAEQLAKYWPRLTLSLSPRWHRSEESETWLRSLMHTQLRLSFDQCPVCERHRAPCRAVRPPSAARSCWLTR